MYYNLGFRVQKRWNEDDAKHSIFYLDSKAETVILGTDIDRVFESIYSTIMTKIWKCQAEGLGWTIDSVI